MDAIERAEKAQQEILAFADWANENPVAIYAMTGHALDLAMRGRRISCNYLVNWLRYEGPVDFTAADGADPWKIPNHFATIFARYLKRYMPARSHLVETAPSWYDDPELEWPPLGALEEAS